MNLFQIIILGGVFVLGVGTGGLSNVTSSGAGVFTIFLLAKYENLSIQEAVGTVLAASTIFVLAGAISFYKKKQVDGQLAITTGLAGVAGSFLSATLASSVQPILVERSLGAFTLLVATYSISRIVRLRKRGQRIRSFSQLLKDDSEASQDQPSRWRSREPLAVGAQLSVGILIGLVTGLFGVAGSGLTMATFLFAFKLRTKMVLGTSLTASFFRYAGGSLGYWSKSMIDPVLFLTLSAGGVIGSIFGARFVTGRTSSGHLQLVVIALLLFTSFEFLMG